MNLNSSDPNPLHVILRFAFTGLRLCKLLLCLFPILLSKVTFAERSVPYSKPNVIFILADDMGYGDLSCYGQDKFETPNIDRIGNEGIRFTQHYAGNTVCSPSRAGLMTGQHPGHAHVRGNLGNENLSALDPEMTVLPELFQSAGYRTGAFGKWGLGITSDTGSASPNQNGFDEFVGCKSQLIAHTYYPSCIVKNGKELPLEKGEYSYDIIMEEAFDFIERNARKRQPFFCYIPVMIPHAAMHAPKDLHEKWRKKLPEFESVIGKYGAGSDEKCPDVINPLAAFAAMMEHLDNDVGRILELLDQSGIDEHTIVIFSSDNGPHSEAGHNPEYWNSNGPLKGLKRDLYEGGIRMPLLVRWKGTVTSGESDHISTFWDWVPTFAEFLHQPIPEQTDGISLLPTLKGQAQREHAYLYWEFWHGKSQTWISRAIRKGKWKLVQGQWLGWNKVNELKPIFECRAELYDLDSDLGETTDLSEMHQETVETLLDLMDVAHLAYRYNGNSDFQK